MTLRFGTGWLLAIAGFAATGAAAQNSPSQAIDSTLAADTRRLLTIMQAGPTMVAAIEASIPAQQAANPRIPQEFWDEFAKRAKNQIPDLVEALVPVYAAHFNDQDVRALIQFYTSPIGHRLIHEQSAITQDSFQAGQRWGTALGAAVAADLTAEGIMQQ